MSLAWKHVWFPNDTLVNRDKCSLQPNEIKKKQNFTLISDEYINKNIDMYITSGYLV